MNKLIIYYSYLGYAIENYLLHLPDVEKIANNSEIDLPYIFFGDDAFGETVSWSMF